MKYSDYKSQIEGNKRTFNIGPHNIDVGNEDGILIVPTGEIIVLSGNEIIETGKGYYDKVRDYMGGPLKGDHLFPDTPKYLDNKSSAATKSVSALFAIADTFIPEDSSSGIVDFKGVRYTGFSKGDIFYITSNGKITGCIKDGRIITRTSSTFDEVPHTREYLKALREQNTVKKNKMKYWEYGSEERRSGPKEKKRKEKKVKHKKGLTREEFERRAREKYLAMKAEAKS